MALELTFKQVCDFAKREGIQDSKLIEAVDHLLGLTLVCAPLVIGPSAAALLPTLAVKNELIKMGKFVFEKLSKKADDNYVGRQERMEVAYGLLVFTAFFEALDRRVPKNLREKIGRLKEETLSLSKKAAVEVGRGQGNCAYEPSSLDPSNPLAALVIPFPHPVESFAQQIKRHAALWKQMSDGFQQFIKKLAFWDELKDKEKEQIQAALSKVPDDATTCFEAQYFELARAYPDFAVWANLSEHKTARQTIENLSEYVRQHVALGNSGMAAIDIGFRKLHDVVLSIPEILATSQATDIVDGLIRHYNARINEPVIEDKDEAEEGRPRLSFPRVSDAFIPQSFRVIRQSAKPKALEDDETWKDLPRRNGLGAFLLNYLSSPYSTESPLLILGHPGSGKSLLTTVLSAQLMSKHYTSIRVPLREVEPEVGIVSQIEEAVRKITSISVDAWAKLSGAFKNNPPVVILDGYDELLQASGKVFAGYLKEVQTFQKNEAEQGRPVRVIVTSRVTLIDKASVPFGATILRLLEFDKDQRKQWISIWNRANANYFREAAVQEFALPDEGEAGAEKVFSLAEQPLLLLMLALYDSEDNRLRKSQGLDRTKLYDSLLRRFVTREREKDRRFELLQASEKKKTLDIEMQRLGAAALGMYNRRKVHILASELNDDLKFFNLERAVEVTSGRPLSQADLLLGSFFFVHKSKEQHTAGAPEHHEEIAAFEFLHNTFGEFLTADFVLRRALAEVEALKALQENEVLRAQLEQRLSDADGFQREWFASLVYTPLFTRPVVLEMMKEWVGHILKERHLAKHAFIANIDTIVVNQIKRLLNRKEMPSITRKETAQEGYRAPFGDYPLLGHIAIYSINLIVLRIIVSEEPLIIDEGVLGTHEDGTRPWDRLTHIWRSWFALDNLNGVTAVMVATRQEDKVIIRAKEKFQVPESQGRLETYLNVAVALGDNISAGLTGLWLFPRSESHLDIDNLAARLESEKIDLKLEVLMKRLAHGVGLYTGHIDKGLAELAEETLLMAMRMGRFEESVQIAELFKRAISRRAYHPHQWRLRERFLRHLEPEFFERALHPRQLLELAERSPESALALIQVMREIGGGRFLRHLQPEFFERAFHPRQLLELVERSPESALAWIQVMREIGGDSFLRHLEPEFFERALHPRQLLELVERSPESALAWIQVMREIGGERFLGHLEPEFFERALHPRQLLELAERSPESALTLIQVMREIGGDSSLRRLEPGFFERAFHPRQFLELVERSPESALAWIQVMREIGGDSFLRRLEPGFFERAFHPRQLLELVERSPESALAWIQVMREIGGDSFLQLVRRHTKGTFKTGKSCLNKIHQAASNRSCSAVRRAAVAA